jgi:hypothetical protein
LKEYFVARAGWLDENETRCFPFLENTIGIAISGSPTVRNLPLNAVVDAGFVVGATSGYSSLGDYVFLNRIWRLDNRFYFEFLSTATGLTGKALVFTRNLMEGKFVTSFEDLLDVEADSSQSISQTPCDDRLEWHGFLTTGPLDDLAALLDDGDAWYNPGSQGRIEPAVIQNLSELLVESVSVANADRTTPLAGTECGDAIDYDPGEVRPWQSCVVGRLLFKPGFNITIEQDTANNALNFRPAVGDGVGEPCGEVPTHPAEGDEGDDLSAALRCRDVLRSINGQGGSVFSLEANAGFALTADPKNNRLIIDANFINMAACIDGVSLSIFSPEPDTTPEPPGSTTTTTPEPSALWSPELSPYPLATWYNSDSIGTLYGDEAPMTVGWPADGRVPGIFSQDYSVADVPFGATAPIAKLGELNGFNVVARSGSQGLQIQGLLNISGGTLSLFFMMRYNAGGSSNRIPIFDTPNSQFSAFTSDSYTAVGGVGQAAGLAIPEDTWCIVSLESAGPGSTYTLRVNGNPVLTGVSGNAFFDSIHLGLNPSGMGTVEGIHIHAEIVGFFAVLPKSERTKVEGYYAHRFAQTSMLPFNHPYRFTAPRV